jgi:hypothetical protein
MNQQPDHFFREKLEGHQRAVPASAWSRVETKLNKKNDKPRWLKIAAAITFLIIASALYVLTQNTDQTNVITEKSTPEVSPEKQKVNPKVKEEPLNNAVSDKTEEKAIAQKAGKKSPGTPVKTIEEITPVIEDDASIDVEEVPENIPTENSVVTIEEGKNEVPQVDKKDTGLMIVYSADEVNDKYLNKKTVADATTEDKKPSTLKKLLDKAYDLKHNQDPLGELRQKKNEILALNFKNEKQRTQNR